MRMCQTASEIDMASALDRAFVIVCSTLRMNSWFKQDTSKLMFLVRFSDQTFVAEHAANMARNSSPPH